MGNLSSEPYDVFLDSLKRAGIEISNETELRERMAEAQRWRYAFMTLAANGKSLGIRFEDQSAGSNLVELNRTLARFEFSESHRKAFAARLRADDLNPEA